MTSDPSRSHTAHSAPLSAAGTSHIVQSLVANLTIATLKGVAAFFTGSGSMLAETIHSTADCGNQLLLLLGVKRAQSAATDSHPLGYGRSLYFWSFLVALLLFSGGGMFSVYEGVHKLSEPEPIEHVGWAVGILITSLLIEGWALYGNVRELNNRRGLTPFFEHLNASKDSDLIVVFGENASAVVGLFLALFAIALASFTGDPRYDALGSLGIGVGLIGISLWLAREVMSLLIGERADPQIEAAIQNLVIQKSEILSLQEVITLQQGPGQVMVSVKLGFDDRLSARELVRSIEEFEKALSVARPEVKWCFVEPSLRHP